MLQGLSAAVLAGGNSSSMGTDKAFLSINDQYFIQIIARELGKITNRIVIVIGEKEPAKFRKAIGSNIPIINDTYKVKNPMGGMVSAFEDYVAVVACDLPLLKSELVSKLYSIAKGHDAAVPVWNNGDLEPLCAVYSSKEGLAVGKKLIEKGIIGCRNLVKSMKDVVYTATDELRDVDKELLSFKNINTERAYKEVLHKWKSIKHNS